MKHFFAILIAAVLYAANLPAQAPGTEASTPAPKTSAPAARSSGSSSGGRSGSSGTPAESSSFLGKDVPFFNPATEMFQWDGKNWNVANQRFFQARFEKYLNAPEETTEEDLAYQKLIRTILQKLAPDTYTPKNLDEAWRLLPQSSNYRIDANLCDAISDAVYSTWLARRNQDRLVFANQELEQQRKQHEWNAQMTAAHSSIANSNATSTSKDLRLQPHLQRLAEVNARIIANTTKREISEIQARIEFQALIVQFLVQRRFQHVTMATRFYRHLFADGGTSMKVGKDVEELLSKGTGMPPTVSTVDTVANEAIRDVREGVDAFKFLAEKNEMESATKRLSEAFIVGEYMPEIRTLPRELKRRALDFTQKANRLVSSLEVRDYTLAESLLKELEPMAKDLDTAQAHAAIETAKTICAMHLAKAKNAAISGDRDTLETEYREALVIWPRNPALLEFSTKVFTQTDVQQKIIAELDQLLSQRNYRQIYDDKIRFIAATALFPDRQEQLKSVLQDVQVVEEAIARSEEYAKHGDPYGAWENTERTFKQYPNDTKLNQLRTKLTVAAAEFVSGIQKAQQQEQKEQFGSSLSWYLKAQKLYPPSEFAQEGIARVVQKVFPTP